ncbi:MAG: PilZ domain-containing protein [Candidatus Omnitrophica bacterium]|nr:PilZ domain-containing protein [Candidatus Omnitrophota bacterium]
MSSWEGCDRRRFVRVNYPCLVVLKKAADKKNIILTHTENIGVGGICVILKQDLKKFASVDLEIDLMDMDQHIQCTGKIVWNVRRRELEDKKPSYFDIGIEFDDVNDQDKKRLRRVVDKLVRNTKERPKL